MADGGADPAHPPPAGCGALEPAFGWEILRTWMLKVALKKAGRGFFLVLAFPLAAGSAFGRWIVPFTMFAQCVACVPGLVGDYFRTAYYRLTLAECWPSSRISFGSFFSKPLARVGDGVYIGPYCVIGLSSIGPRTQIATAAQILSGRHQHARDASGHLLSASPKPVRIGADCWIGAAAIVMEDIGDESTIGAGAVVSRPIPPRSVAVGNPARVIRSLS